MAVLETFISIETAQKLAKRLQKMSGERRQEIIRIGDTFGDPELLAKYYVQPNCQHHNPADYDEDEVRSPVYTPAFDSVNTFMSGDMPTRDGRTQLFVLSDAGMGKTSLLTMLKLTHLTSFWPQGYECILLKLGEDTLETIETIENRSKKVLLLDALDEDPTAWDNIKNRLLDLLKATALFHRVIISCRTQFFPEKELDPFGRPGQVRIEGFACPMLFVSPF
ncbi:MAG: effector protein PipB, partial [Pseudomonadota bacterium]